MQYLDFRITPGHDRVHILRYSCDQEGTSSHTTLLGMLPITANPDDFHHQLHPFASFTEEDYEQIASYLAMDPAVLSARCAHAGYN